MENDFHDNESGRKPKKERVRSSIAASILGVEMRTVQERASLGLIPSAAKVGKAWTFNERELRDYVKREEGQNGCRTISTVAETSGGPAPKSTAASYAKAYEQQISRKQRSA